MNGKILCIKIKEGGVIMFIFPDMYIKNLFNDFRSKCIFRSARIKQLTAAQYGYGITKLSRQVQIMNGHQYGFALIFESL